jgi:hypothetical protein
MGEKKMHAWLWWVNVKAGDHLEDLYVIEIILKWRLIRVVGRGVDLCG